MTADLSFAGKRIPGEVLEERGLRLAGGLAGLGLKQDDVMAVMLRNDPAYVDAIAACRSAGCFYCPINWHFKADEVGYILADSGAKVLLIHSDLLPVIADAIPPTVTVLVAPSSDHDPVDVSCYSGAMEFETWLAEQTAYDGPPRTPRGHMAYTSGTTGRPKGVRRLAPSPHQEQRQLAQMRHLMAVAWGIKPGVRALVSAPLYHSAPSSFARLALAEGARLVLAPRFDPEETLALIERHSVETVFLVPIMFVRLLRLPKEVRDRYDISSVRFVASTGAPCAPQVKREMLEWWGPVIYESYASSETGMVTVQNPEEARRKPGSVGRPIGDAVIRIVDDDGHECAAGQPGLIYCRQPAMTDFTYQNRPQDRDAIGLDGLASVGDIGYLDEDGYLYVCDRASDMVISGGVNIYPAEIENVLMGIPGVVDCAVFGIPDPEYGESLAAVVGVDRDDRFTEAMLRERVRARIAGYKVPRQLKLVRQLPRDDNGKVAKHRLKAWWQAEWGSEA